jgi:opacity protein-like surface antigen
MRNLKRTMAMNRSALSGIVLIFLMCCLMSSAAFSQSSPTQNPPDQAPPPEPAAPAPPVVVPKVQVFGGYAFIYEGLGYLNATFLDTDLNLYPRKLIPQQDFNGWNAEGQYNISPWVGVVGDVSGTITPPFIAGTGVSGVPTGSSYSIMAGPVVSYRKIKNLTPFVHALFGWNRTSLSAATPTSSTPIGTTPFPVSSVGTTFTDFAMAFGGGLDYKVTPRFSLRPVQLDWYRTSLNFNSFYGTAFNNTLVQGFETKQKNLRVSTGVVVNFK